MILRVVHTDDLASTWLVCGKVGIGVSSRWWSMGIVFGWHVKDGCARGSRGLAIGLRRNWVPWLQVLKKENRYAGLEV